MTLFFFDLIYELNDFLLKREKKVYITIFNTWMHKVSTKKIKVYLIVPKDVSNKEAYLTQTKKAKQIWNILVVINTDVINLHICNFKIVKAGTFIK